MTGKHDPAAPPECSRVGRWLLQAHPFLFSAYCIAAAFSTYFCMYAFRKPFTAGTFAGEQWLGFDYKVVLVTTQVAGYTLSKFIGIKVVSEMSARYRAVAIAVLILIAEAALLLFAVTPPPYNFVWLFVNGLPLGMVFGLVLGYLEGRRFTEALSAGLCASFIVSSGVVKSIGQYLVKDLGVSEYWMPVATGAIFLPLMAISVWALAQIPPPDPRDEALRTRRVPMDGSARLSFFKRHWLGLCCLLLIIVMLTIVRSIRDDFGVEIWQQLGFEKEPEVFAQSEFWVMVGVTLINALVIVIPSNRRAFLGSLGIMGLGFGIVGCALTGHYQNLLSPFAFMVLLGLGMYIPYVAFHTTIYERMMAAFREPGTIAYLMYLSDSLGYLAYVLLIIVNSTVGDEARNQVNYLQLLNWTSLIVAAVSLVICLLLAFYYQRTLPAESHAAVPRPEES